MNGISFSKIETGDSHSSVASHPPTSRPTQEGLAEAMTDSKRVATAEEIVESAEREMLLVAWNQTRREYPRDHCVHQLFEEQVERTPDGVAVVFDDQELTYQELNRRANRLAHHLRQLGVRPETLVAICAERSVEMIVGLLAILKAGGAYVPLDPAYPKHRLAFMFEDSKVSVLLAHKKLAPLFSSTRVQVVYLDEPLRKNTPGRTQTAGPSPESNVNNGVAPENLAYVIYTSGSTGKPKGVQIPHRAVVNFLHAMRQEPGLTSDDVLLSVTTLSFDIAGLELFLPLTTGARLVIARRETALNGRLLAAELAQRNATVLQATPVTWRNLLEADWPGNPKLKALCGGEALPPDLVRQLLPKCASLWNMYGPTETTIWSTCARVTENDQPISIGRPIANTLTYILNARHELSPMGVPGELYIGGDGVARGYLDRPEVTAEKFIPHPFSDQPGARLYRTGDLARYFPDGRIECRGRLDHQVKLRGQRIELGEIEAVLARHPEVRRAVAVIREDVPGDRRLVAYMVPVGDRNPDSGVLRDFLLEQLPAHMVPSVFHWLEAVPLTPNGKVDRRALPVPPAETARPARGYVPPRTPIEELLADIWSDALGKPRISIHDNFFELGGQSLMSVQVIDRLNKAGLELTFERFIQRQTIAELALAVTPNRTVASGESSWSSLVTLQSQGTKPPFFLIHTAPGDVLGYMKLVYYLGLDQPCYGFQSLGLGQREASHRTVPEMAAHYAKLMREFQPEGPYFFGGWCFGGTVALEMAHQLVQQSQRVALLALMETRVHPPPLTYHRFHLHRLRRFVGLGPAGMARLVSRKFLRRAPKPNGADDQEEEFAFQAVQSGPLANREYVYAINTTAENEYESRPCAFPGRLTLINGTASDSWDADDPAGGFATLADEIELYKIPGDHRSVLKEPKVKLLAETLKACLEKAQQNSARTNRRARTRSWESVTFQAMLCSHALHWSEGVLGVLGR